MAEAFDQAWARIAPTFGNVPQEIVSMLWDAGAEAAQIR
jgi:hypothetical protein